MSMLMLRVLSGRQSQVEVPLAVGRYLLGNDTADCDLVIDLGVRERHVVVLRVDESGLTVIALAGDTWLSESYLPAQQSAALQPRQVLTVGRASMAVAEPGFDFSSLALPGALRKPGDTPELVAVALPPRTPRVLRAASVFRASVLAACAITAAGTLVWGSGVVSGEATSAHGEDRSATAALQDQVHALGYADVHVISEGDARQSVVVGYVPDAAAYLRLEQTLSRLPRVPALRVHPVRPLTDGLAQRLSQAGAKEALQYAGQGVFEISTDSARFNAVREAAERAMKDLPGIHAVRIAFTDMTLPPGGQAAKVTVARSTGRLGELVVSGDGLPLPVREAELPRFVEIRQGEVPSVVTRQGERLFVGARLPDGAVISRIEPRAVVLAKGGAERVETLPGATPLAPPGAVARAVITVAKGMP